MAVFISYTMNGQHGRAFVEGLAEALEARGVRAVYDARDLGTDDLHHWIEKGITQSDCVLCVCTPEYKLRYDDRKVGSATRPR